MLPRASVYDLRSIQSLPDYRYYFDTNTLLFIFGRTFIEPKSYQNQYYPSFFKAIRKEKRIVFTFVQNVLEFLGVMDSKEKALKNVNSIKEYRQSELAECLSTRKDIYEDITQSLNIFGIHILPDHVSSYFEIDCSLDIKDYVFIQLARQEQTAFVTDDQEFIFMDGITVFTANANAIQFAQRSHHLMNP
jgi:hypothetical protein